GTAVPSLLPLACPGLLSGALPGRSEEAAASCRCNYEFLTVKIGAYKIEATLASFSTARLENVRVAVGARQRVDLTMKVGEVTTTIEVSASAALLVETDTSDRGQVINQRQIVELPLNGRNYSDLALLTTGVRRSAYAFANPPREGSFNVNGQRSIFNNFLMDGVDNNGYGTSNQGFSSQVVQATPDALAEFKVVTSVMSAEFGRSSGAVINASIKSGTNEFHGSAWEFLRNTSLNAAGYFPPRTGKPVFQRNQFGLTFGGPIVKNRAFFFTNWEGFRER
ncbi:MAG: carboxypeptidase-like regulatory domain-containing protein, partial [Acidobacteria bacterium]|nr:carboxypeptidase-like regulatory domain-containing protein [Acidobacteriota bacterium]